jgi:preprotein translocase subunit SecA
MRIFAGEWVSNLLARLGMEEGQAIESRMVSRRISGAQKKREEYNFDIRKNLLEYDEVMDHQRKEVYGYRQRILDGANCKVLIMGMFDKQVDLAVERFLDADYGADTFAEFAANRLGVQFDGGDFARSTFEEADKVAREKASRAVGNNIQEALDENLGAEDSKEWNWQALAHQVNTRYSLKTNDRQLKQIGKDNLFDHLSAEAQKAVDEIDLTDGKPYLESDWGVRSLCDWARLKYSVKLTPEELTDRNPSDVVDILRERVHALYRQKEIEFPVSAGMAQFMSDRGQAGGGQRYNREGLYHWAKERFPAATDRLIEDDFRTQSRQKLHDLLVEVSKVGFPDKFEESIDQKYEDVFEGSARKCDAEDAQDLATWMKDQFGVEIDPAKLTDQPARQVRDALWNAFDQRYRPEMKQMERSLLLHQLDTSWKNHLYQMDHLRSGIGLVGYAQEDPKTVYKQEGMKEFRAMWEGVEDKVTEMVFRMEESEAFAETIWMIGAATKESAPRPEAQGQSTNASTGEVKVTDPIRNRGQKVGRNDPCPCGSGKKYKNCHMRQTA